MAKFLYAYSGGNGVSANEEERNAQYAKWSAWMGTLGPSLVDMGAPFARSSGGGNLTGYSIVEAASLDDAVAKAKGCPVYEVGGNVEVYEAIAM